MRVASETLVPAMVPLKLIGSLILSAGPRVFFGTKKGLGLELDN